ncbi:MAG: hypothetical protein DME46_00510, partial [Verrucomicrobia bacterium]
MQKKKRRQHRGPAGVRNVDLFLKGEGQPCPRHTEVVAGTVKDVPAEISQNTDMGRDTDFEAAAKLPNKAALVFCGGEAELSLLIKSHSSGLVIMAAEDTTGTGPNVGRETRTVD